MRADNSAEQQRRVGTAAGVGAYFCWGVFPLYFSRLKAIAPLELAAWRVVLTALTMWGVLAVRRDLAWWTTVRSSPRRLMYVAIAALLIGSNWLIYVWAIANEHVVDAAIGYFINPLLSVLLGVTLLGERLRRLQQFAIGLGACSVCVLTIAYGTVPWVALALAVTFAFYGLMKKRIALDGMQSLAGETLMVLPLGVIGLLWFGQDGFDLVSSGATTFVLGALVGFATALPLVLFGVAATRVPLTTIGLLQYTAPVLQLMCGAFILGEKVSGPRWLGISLVVAALACLAADLLRSE
jgi:chloramphenicol-sensitive protein RarD